MPPSSSKAQMPSPCDFLNIALLKSLWPVSLLLCPGTFSAGQGLPGSAGQVANPVFAVMSGK